MIKPSFGVIVGRFQVHELHDGHMELFRAVRGLHNRVIVFVGVSPVGSTPHNPLDFEARARMIQSKFPDFTVLPLKDTMTDEMWSKNLDEKIREVVSYGDVTLYGGRRSFVPHYSGGYKPVELTLLLGDKFSGEEVRATLTNTVKESADFRAGIIHAAMNTRPRVVTTVDGVVFHLGQPKKVALKDFDGLGYPDMEFLLGRKKGEPGWRFIGGHAEPTSGSFEEDVRNEVMEEGSVDIRPENVGYIGSCIVPDWRYDAEDSKIKTLVFACQATTLSARAGDDIDEIMWFSVSAMEPGLFVPTHRPLLELIKKYFYTKFTVRLENATSLKA